MMDNTRAKLPPVLDVTCGGRMMYKADKTRTEIEITEEQV